MLSRRQGALVLLLLWTVVPGAWSAQNKFEIGEAPDRTIAANARSEKPIKPRLINADEGLAILGVALESRHRVDSSSDCSHLVHAIYERAGLSYPYANSFELYSGVEKFRRVTHPRPGDLVVWVGHVGIMINPTQHSFFSALRSGRGVESYDSPYWQKRGRPRFFRYVKSAATVFSAAPHDASWTPPGLESTDSSVPVPSRDFDSAESFANKTKLPSTPVELLPASPVTARVQAADSARPTAAEVTEGLLRWFSSTGEALQGEDLFSLPQSLIVFDNFEVGRLRVKGKEGWAEIRVKERSSLTRGRTNLERRSDRQHWPLARNSQGHWELILPRETIYLSRDTAVRILAHQLAVLTDSQSAGVTKDDKKVVLARLLNVLLEK